MPTLGIKWTRLTNALLGSEICKIHLQTNSYTNCQTKHWQGLATFGKRMKCFFKSKESLNIAFCDKAMN